VEMHCDITERNVT